MSLICPRCGGIAVCNGGVRAVCRECGKSFNKVKGKWATPENDIVINNTNENEFSHITIERLI